MLFKLLGLMMIVQYCFAQLSIHTEKELVKVTLEGTSLELLLLPIHTEKELLACKEKLDQHRMCV